MIERLVFILGRRLDEYCDNRDWNDADWNADFG